jgi:hypothetical protein
MGKTYRAFIEMTFEPNENGYLEWESSWDLTAEELEEEGEKPRTKEEMLRFFADELWEYLMENLSYDAITVEEVKE